MKVAIFYIGEKIANTVYDHLMSFQTYGQHTYHYVDVLKEKISSKETEKYDAIVVHYTVSLFNDERCPASLRLVLRNAKAKKIIFIQDEYRRVNDVIENLDFIKADLLFTCVPESEIEKVYSTEKLPSLIKVNTLTGFVPEILLSRYRPTYEERQVDVVYRARKLSAWYGRLGQEKWMISEKFNQDAKKYNLKTDISYHEKDRIYGDQWIDFLTNSKAAIGCESGASVFDFTGTIQDQVEEYETTHSHATFEEIEEKFFKGLDGQIKLNQISPRCFECAALGTLMVLYEGDYSNILKPWRHYVPLKKDHSNMDEVVSTINSSEEWKRITKNAFEEIAMNQNYHCSGFIKKFERDLEHFLNIPPLGQKQGGIVSELKSNFASKKQSIYARVMIILKKLINKVFGKKITNTLIFHKRRIELSLQTLRSLYSNRESSLIFYFYSIKKDFCEEYMFIKNIKEYIFFIKEMCDFVPLAVKNNRNEKKISVYLSDNLKQKEKISFSKASPGEICSLEVDDSWGVPQNIRGKSVVLKYIKISDNRNQF
jgi:hypothetical protein